MAKEFFRRQEEAHGAVWLTHWKLPEDFALTPPEHDYRDRFPVRPEDVAAEYAPVVKDGTWTFGAFQCWGKRQKVARSAVHIPCCPSFNPNPCRWRGVCFGRSLMECYWFSVDRTRWSRMVHALRLGREYTEPFEGFGKDDKHEISSLCCFMCCLGVALTLGVGQFFSVCGNYGLNCAACYTCHAREKLRRRYKLPPAFGLPPGIDDCLMHLICLYCATHQEMREAIARGMDGPGISPLDVHPQSWAHLPGFAEEMEHRKLKLAAIKECGINFPPFEQRMERDFHAWRGRLHEDPEAVKLQRPPDAAFVTTATVGQPGHVGQKAGQAMDANEALRKADTDVQTLVRSYSVAY